MRTILLALRNILKNRRRTFITFLAIITGLTGYIVFGGFIEFTLFGLRELTIWTQYGHIQIYKKGYSEKGIAQPAKYLINNPENIEKSLSEIPGIGMVTSRLTFSGIISTGDKTLPCKGVGIDVEKEGRMNTSKKLNITIKKEGEKGGFESIVDGVPLDPNIIDGGLVGFELMKALGAKVGDYLTLLTTTSNGTLNGLDFKIIGVAQTSSQEYDSLFVKLPFNLVQNLLDTDKTEKIIIFLDDIAVFNDVKSKIHALIKKNDLDLEIKSWSDLAIFYNRVVGLYNGIFKVVKIIIALIVLFSIANTMTMSIFERIREIGTLRAIGTTRLGIIKLFMIEGILIGILGGLLGVLVGVLMGQIINIGGGIYIPPPPNISFGYMARILILPSIIIYGFILIVMVSTVSSIYPALKASRLKIVEALHHI